MPDNKKEEKIMLSFAVSREDKEALLKFCQENDENMSRVLRKALREYLQYNG